MISFATETRIGGRIQIKMRLNFLTLVENLWEHIRNLFFMRNPQIFMIIAGHINNSYIDIYKNKII